MMEEREVLLNYQKQSNQDSANVDQNLRKHLNQSGVYYPSGFFKSSKYFEREFKIQSLSQF